MLGSSSFLTQVSALVLLVYYPRGVHDSLDILRIPAIWRPRVDSRQDYIGTALNHNYDDLMERLWNFKGKCWLPV